MSFTLTHSHTHTLFLEYARVYTNVLWKLISEFSSWVRSMRPTAHNHPNDCWFCGKFERFFWIFSIYFCSARQPIRNDFICIVEVDRCIVSANRHENLFSLIVGRARLIAQNHYSRAFGGQLGQQHSTWAIRLNSEKSQSGKADKKNTHRLFRFFSLDGSYLFLFLKCHIQLEFIFRFSLFYHF